MTFEEFSAECQALQLMYIERERARYGRARDLLATLGHDANAYRVAAYQREGLHPLRLDEIAARLAQLDSMQAEISETHGDNELTRWAYAQQGAEATAPGSILARYAREGAEIARMMATNGYSYAAAVYEVETRARVAA